jgi:hypothetical protein
MNKPAIKTMLLEQHHSFITYLDGLTNEEFLVSKNGKWTAGQQLEHIVISVKPLRQVLRLPKFILPLIWGKANRASKSYEDLVKKYLAKLENGGRATPRFSPKTVSVEKRQALQSKLKKEVEKLAKQLDKMSEEELDQYILPHPLLGKLTIREMLYFTIYHVQHQEELTKRNLQ